MMRGLRMMRAKSLKMTMRMRMIRMMKKMMKRMMKRMIMGWRRRTTTKKMMTLFKLLKVGVQL